MGLGASEAADVLYALTSPEVYLQRWLRSTLRTLLLGQSR
jgi:hypothetical protein